MQPVKVTHDMAFRLICETTGPAVRTPIGIMGDETAGCECKPVPRYGPGNTISTALTAADHAILPFSYVVQSLPSKDEFSAPSWNQNFVGNVPTIFGNFYRRSFDPDTCALGPAGVSQDGIDDPEAAMDDPIAAARTAVLLHGTTSTLADDRFFRHAFLGMYVELIPTDSGLRPEGYSQYGPPLMRPVLAEHIRGTMFYNSTAPNMALVSAGYMYLATDDSSQQLPEEDRVALLAEIWDLCKVASMPTRPLDFESDAEIDSANVETPHSRMSARSKAVSAAIGMDDPFKHLACVYERKARTFDEYLNPWAIFDTTIKTKDHANEFYLGSPACPSILMHLYQFHRTSVSYIFPSTDTVYEFCLEATAEKDRKVRWGAVGEEVEFFGVKYYQFPIRSIHDQLSFDKYFATCGKKRIAGGSGIDVVWKLGGDLKKREELVKHLTAGLTSDEAIGAFGDVEGLEADDKDILTAAGKELHKRAQVPLTLLHMAQIFKDHVFFLDHEFLGEHIRKTVATKSDATKLSVKCSGGKKATISLGGALGSVQVATNKNSGNIPKYEFSKYAGAPTVRHPIIENLMDLIPSRKRQRDTDLQNDRTLEEASLEKVMSELEKRHVRAKWIIGEFITVESRNTIRICLRKPFVYM